METFDEKQLLKAISEGDEKAFKTFFLYYYPASKGLSTDYCNRKKRPKIYRRTSFLRYGTTAHPSIPSITLNLIFPHFQNAVYRHIERTLLFRNYQQKETEKYIRHWKATKPMTTSTLKELELLVTMVVEKMPPATTENI